MSIALIAYTRYQESSDVEILMARPEEKNVMRRKKMKEIEEHNTTILSRDTTFVFSNSQLNGSPLHLVSMYHMYKSMFRRALMARASLANARSL